MVVVVVAWLILALARPLGPAVLRSTQHLQSSARQTGNSRLQAPTRVCGTLAGAVVRGPT